MTLKKGTLAFVTLASVMTLMACGNDGTVETPDSPDVEKTTETSTMTDTTNPSASESKGIENMEFDQSVQDAIDVFNERFADANITSIAFDTNQKTYVYEIQGHVPMKEVELKMDAMTGEIIKVEEEKDALDIRDEDVLDLVGLVSPQEAMRAALAEVGSGYAKEWTLDSENGVTYYEIDVEGSTQSDDVRINAQTGQFIGYD